MSTETKTSILLINLPEVIIYGSLNTDQEEKEKCKNFLVSKRFSVKESGWNTVAIRK